MKRRKARECALQMLFQLDISTEKPSAAMLKRFWSGHELEDDLKVFAEEIVKGVYKHREKINRKIRESAKNWSLDRMAAVDRNVIRIAAYEMLFRMDIPTSVAINEAIEIAKRFGTDESGAFVNGILDSMARTAGKLDAERGEGAVREAAPLKGPAQ